jgi:hypothetical protein
MGGLRWLLRRFKGPDAAGSAVDISTPGNDEASDFTLSPNVRLRMTVAEEMRLDPNNEVFNDELHAKYVSMYSEAERQLHGSAKGVVYADTGLCLLLFGKNVKIPGIDFGIQDIPAATEVLTVFASFYFLVMCQAFANTQCYLAIIEQFSHRKALKLGIDPEYITYADVFSQTFLKAFRFEMSYFGSDFFQPGKRYQRFYGAVTLLLALSWLSLLAMHFSVVSAGVLNSLGTSWLWWLLAVAILLLHVTGLVMNIFVDFRFDPLLRSKVQESRRQIAERYKS